MVILLASIGLMGASLTAAFADTLAQNVGTTGTNSADLFAGQSVTTGSGGPWDHIVFTFMGPSGNIANGHLFILSDAYAGTASSLSSSTTGFLAESNGISSNGWVFDPTFSLVPNTQYFFYSDFDFAPNTVSFSGDQYAGGNLFLESDSFGFTHFSPLVSQDFDFRLTGTLVAPTAVPEPRSLVLLIIPLCGLLAVKMAKALPAQDK
jgi:hypothetical protein